MKLTESANYFIGTDGSYDGCIMSTTPEFQWIYEGDDIYKLVEGFGHERPLPAVVITSTPEVDEDGLWWARSEKSLVHLVFHSDDETEFEAICNGLREVVDEKGCPVKDENGHYFFVESSCVNVLHL